jgi:hypothetical protein
MEQMKTCFKCGKEKELNQFYVHKQMADGRLGKCIECAKADVAARVLIRSKDPAWIAKERERGREKMKRRRAIGIMDTPSKEVQKRWRDKNKEKRQAHSKAANAQKRNRIIKPDRCESCGSIGYVEKHHPDYSKPLSVQWLCKNCHGLTWRK